MAFQHDAREVIVEAAGQTAYPLAPVVRGLGGRSVALPSVGSDRGLHGQIVGYAHRAAVAIPDQFRHVVHRFASARPAAPYSTAPPSPRSPYFTRYRSNQAMTAAALAADCEGRAAKPPWLAPGTLTRAVGTPRIWSAA